MLTTISASSALDERGHLARSRVSDRYRQDLEPVRARPLEERQLHLERVLSVRGVVDDCSGCESCGAEVGRDRNGPERRRPRVRARHREAVEWEEVRRAEEGDSCRPGSEGEGGRRHRARVLVAGVGSDEPSQVGNLAPPGSVEQRVDGLRQLARIGRVEEAGDGGTPGHAAMRTGSRFPPHVPGLSSKTPAHGSPHEPQRPSERFQAPSSYQSRSIRIAPQCVAVRALPGRVVDVARVHVAQAVPHRDLPRVRERRGRRGRAVEHLPVGVEGA